jgi:hypothetical protein
MTTAAEQRAPESNGVGTEVGSGGEGLGGGGGARRGALLGPLFADLLAPIAVFYVAQSLGISTLNATLLAGLATLPRQLVQLIRHRRLDGLGITVLASFVLGALLTLSTGDMRLMAVKDAIWPLVAGLVTAGSCLRGKPVTFYLFRPLLTQGRVENRPLWDEVWEGGVPVSATLFGRWRPFGRRSCSSRPPRRSCCRCGCR